MSNGSFTYRSPTHGIISITDTALKNDAPALVLIHGNSSSSRIFRNFLTSNRLRATHRVITFDLPGHGASSNSEKPVISYSMRGYADLTKDIVEHLNLSKVVVFGWSLGGHVAIELIPLLPKGVLKGIIITGTPPALGHDEVYRGFKFEESQKPLAAKNELSGEEIEAFSHSAGLPYEKFMEADVKRADGRARELMFNAFTTGHGVDQRKIVESEADVLVGVVNGGDEQFVNLDYLDQIRWKNLWKGRCYRMDGLGHAPFWEKPEEFETILVEFLSDVEVD